MSMIAVHFLTDPAAEIEAPIDREATLPAVPSVGDRVVFDPGIPREFEVEAVRWCVKPAHPMDRGMPNQLAKVVVFLRLFDASADPIKEPENA